MEDGTPCEAFLGSMKAERGGEDAGVYRERYCFDGLDARLGEVGITRRTEVKWAV